jgi:hypothetical protein
MITVDGCWTAAAAHGMESVCDVMLIRDGGHGCVPLAAVALSLSPDEVVGMFGAVRDAKALAAGLVRAGVSGAEPHQAVVDLFAERGYAADTSGFTHNLGHGVGLEVHELPSIGPGSGHILGFAVRRTIERRSDAGRDAACRPVARSWCHAHARAVRHTLVGARGGVSLPGRRTAPSVGDPGRSEHGTLTGGPRLFRRSGLGPR